MDCCFVERSVVEDEDEEDFEEEDDDEDDDWVDSEEELDIRLVTYPEQERG